jgi:hypothetical protein
MLTLTETTPPVSTGGPAQADSTAPVNPSTLKHAPEEGTSFLAVLEQFKGDAKEAGLEGAEEQLATSDVVERPPRREPSAPHPSDGDIDDPDVVEPPQEATDDEFPPEIVESEMAYDRDTLSRLSSRHVFDALQYESEFKDTFGFAWVDEEVRGPVEKALQLALDLQEDGTATPLGMVAAALKELLKGHLRAFGRYYSGKDPWPRPSSVVQAEIDKEMPFALNWLRVELEEALKWERFRGVST